MSPVRPEVHGQAFERFWRAREKVEARLSSVPAKARTPPTGGQACRGGQEELPELPPQEWTVPAILLSFYCLEENWYIPTPLLSLPKQQLLHEID